MSESKGKLPLKRNHLRGHSLLKQVIVTALVASFCTVYAETTAFPNGAWARMEASSAGFDQPALTRAVDAMPGRVMVVRNGYVVASKGDLTDAQPIYSATKSAVSLIYGSVLQSGRVNLDDTVAGADATWRQFLSMTSDFLLDPHRPGLGYAYNNLAYQYFAGVMQDQFFGGAAAMEVLRNALPDLGFEDAITYQGLWGGWNGGFGLSPRDMARLGLLVLNDGAWRGRQLVPASYIQALYQNQIPSAATLNTSGDSIVNQFDTSRKLPGNYSYGWWTNAGGIAPDAPRRVVYADGFGGNFIIVYPGAKLVIAAAGTNVENPLQSFLQPVLATMVQQSSDPRITGDLGVWKPLTLTIDGPFASETGSPNPFTDYAIEVLFRHGSRELRVPGYFAADGAAAESSATEGPVWRAHFIPDEPGDWTYTVRFTQNGASIAPDGMTGSFTVAASGDKGILRYDGTHYLRFSGTGESWLKAGANSPENLLAYGDFDGTRTDKHYFGPHVQDWKQGDPVWKGARGKGLIGAMNYLASKGVNASYFLTMNVGGDGDDVWPWGSKTDHLRFDVSKLAQWDVVFSHMEKLGIAMHVLLQETENDHLLDAGELGPERRLYLKELIARFAHHRMLFWNIGEENVQTTQQRRDMAAYIRGLDIYAHPIVVHNPVYEDQSMFNPLLGDAKFDGPSLQITAPELAHVETQRWLFASESAQRPWPVSIDEIGPANVGAPPDTEPAIQSAIRRDVLWPSLMAGGAGIEWYFGYSYPNNDLSLEDYRSRDRLWDFTRKAFDFFRTQLPFDQMRSRDDLAQGVGALCFARPGWVYSLFLPYGREVSVDLGAFSGTFDVAWFNPRTGESVQSEPIEGPGWKLLGAPPSETEADWTVVVKSRVTPNRFTLRVFGGSGSGEYAAGEVVPVVASSGFSKWMGDTSSLDAKTSPQALLTMPSRDVILTADATSVRPRVARLALVEAGTNRIVPGWDQIADGAVLRFNELPAAGVSIVAITDPPIVDNVRFLVNGVEVRMETSAPYALAGDANGVYNAWTPAEGQYRIAAIPSNGDEFSVSITVVR